MIDLCHGVDRTRLRSPFPLFGDRRFWQNELLRTRVYKRRSKLSRTLGRPFRELRTHPVKMGLGRRLPGTYRSASAPLSSGVRNRKDYQNWLVFVQLKGTWNLPSVRISRKHIIGRKMGSALTVLLHYPLRILLVNTYVVGILVYDDVSLQHFAFDL